MLGFDISFLTYSSVSYFRIATNIVQLSVMDDCNFSIDENCERCSGFVSEYWYRSSWCCEDLAMCPHGVLDGWVLGSYCVSYNIKYHTIFWLYYFIPILDPMVLTPQKALDEIGSRLQKQYERWQPRVMNILIRYSWIGITLSLSNSLTSQGQIRKFVNQPSLRGLLLLHRISWM